MSKKSRTQKYEVYNYRILWSLVRKNLKKAQEQSSNAKTFSLGAMLFVYFTFEGYLNWLGSLIAPKVWSNERSFFSKGSYKGTLGKYRYLRKLLHLPEPDFFQGSAKTLKSLEMLRNDTVHSKQERGTRVVKSHKDHQPPDYEGNLAKQVSLNKAERATRHCEEVINELHVKAHEYFPDLIRESIALEGFLGFDITDC
jgi:hypothetical protein